MNYLKPHLRNIILFLVMTLIPVGTLAFEPSLEDLPASYLQSKNILSNYQPKEETTRVVALEMILKVAATCNKNEIAEEKKVTNKKLFSDISKKDPFYDIVAEAKQKGIVRGYKKGKKRYFKPYEEINLAEALRMLFESTHLQTELKETTLLASLPTDSWYGKDISYAVSRTMLSQQQDGAIFPPHEKLTQKELALLLYRFLKTREGSNFGFASWYGDGLAKTKLEKNAEYKEQNLTAAHKTLPFGSVVRVTNMRNGKSVDVVINDRGPYVTGRIIDLSKTAFSQLAEPSTGVVSVEIEIINSKNQEPNSKQESNNPNF